MCVIAHGEGAVRWEAGGVRVCSGTYERAEGEASGRDGGAGGVVW